MVALQVYMSAVLSAVLLALALVAVSTLDGSSTAVVTCVKGWLMGRVRVCAAHSLTDD